MNSFDIGQKVVCRFKENTRTPYLGKIVTVGNPVWTEILLDDGRIVSGKQVFYRGVSE